MSLWQPLLAQLSSEGVTLGWGALWAGIVVGGGVLGTLVVVAMRLGRLLEQISGLREDMARQSKRHDGLTGEVQSNTRTIGRHDERLDHVEQDVNRLWHELRTRKGGQEA